MLRPTILCVDLLFIGLLYVGLLCREVGVTRMMGPKMGPTKNERTGHKIGPKRFPEVILVPLDRKFRPCSF